MHPTNKAQFIKLTQFLAQALGRDYEIVLHDISADGMKIAEIANNHISGRTIDSPITGFALDLVQKKVYQERDYLSNYKASAGGKSIKGSTFFIKENGELAGMLCINYDRSRMEEIAQQLLGEAPCDEVAEEVLSLDLGELISELVGENAAELKARNLRPKERQEIVDKLYEKGAFNIKGAITQIAELLGLSESSIYRCLAKSREKFGI